MIRQNKYVIYKGIEYIYRRCDENKNNGLVRIVSYDRRSLADGFFTIAIQQIIAHNNKN